MDNSILDTLEDSFLGLIDTAVDFTPRILAAIILLVIGSIVSKWASKLIAGIVKKVESDKRVVESMKKLNIKMLSISSIVGMIIKWSILLIFVSAAVDSLGVDVLTNTFNQLLAFVPKIFAASVIAGIAFIVSGVVKDVSSTAMKEAGVKAHGFIGSSAKVAVLVFGLPLAVAQLGLDLTVINNNLTMIVAGVMLAFGLAFGLGGREVAGKIVEEQYRNLKR